MLCPYCLRDTPGSPCKQCKEVLPPLYTQNHGLLAKKPAIFSAVGFSGHGKTVYLAALLDVLESDLVVLWNKHNFHRQGLDTDSIQNVKKNLALLKKGELPESTRRVFPRPSLHRLNHIPHYGTCDLLIYDPSGETFESDGKEIERHAHFVQRAHVVVFLVSLHDLEEPKDNDLHRLLEIYVTGMAQMKAKTRVQHLVITYTKADLLKDSLQKYPTVYTHLEKPSYQELMQPKVYLERLKQVSTELEAYTERRLRAYSFIAMARTNFKSVAYCTVSALGHPPENGHLATAMEPLRVVDPLLWVLERS